MSLIEPTHVDPATEYNINLWITGETCRFYVEQRRQFCSFLEQLDLYFSAPICTECASSDMFPPGGFPDISYRSWKEDVAWCLGEDFLSTIKKELNEDPDFGFRCKHCYKNLQPWARDDVYIVRYHLEDHYRFPLIKQGQIEPSRVVQKQIKSLYDNRCFGCNKKRRLNIDHINPRSNGGNAEFRNLQPLCEDCGQLKGDRIPNEIIVHDIMYFGLYPSDGYEGLFW
jgi:hypothetical protein